MLAPPSGRLSLSATTVWYTAGAVAGDGRQTPLTPHRPPEGQRATLLVYHPNEEVLGECINRIQCAVVLDGPFASGGVCQAYRLWFVAGSGQRSRLHIAKRYTHHKGLTGFQEDYRASCLTRHLVTTFNQLLSTTGLPSVRCLEVNRLLDVDGQLYSVEEFLEGEFCKYNNIFGRIELPLGGRTAQGCDLANAFTHFSFVRSGGAYAVLDLQGVGTTWTDVAIVSRTKAQFGFTDTGPEGLQTFFATHVCTAVCQALGLPPVSADTLAIAPVPPAVPVTAAAADGERSPATSSARRSPVTPSSRGTCSVSRRLSPSPSLQPKSPSPSLQPRSPWAREANPLAAGSSPQRTTPAHLSAEPPPYTPDDVPAPGPPLVWTLPPASARSVASILPAAAPSAGDSSVTSSTDSVGPPSLGQPELPRPVQLPPRLVPGTLLKLPDSEPPPGLRCRVMDSPDTLLLSGTLDSLKPGDPAAPSPALPLPPPPPVAAAHPPGAGGGAGPASVGRGSVAGAWLRSPRSHSASPVLLSRVDPAPEAADPSEALFSALKAPPPIATPRATSPGRATPPLPDGAAPPPPASPPAPPPAPAPAPTTAPPASPAGWPPTSPPPPAAGPASPWAAWAAPGPPGYAVNFRPDPPVWQVPSPATPDPAVQRSLSALLLSQTPRPGILHSMSTPPPPPAPSSSPSPWTSRYTTPMRSPWNMLYSHAPNSQPPPPYHSGRYMPAWSPVLVG